MGSELEARLFFEKRGEHHVDLCESGETGGGVPIGIPPKAVSGKKIFLARRPGRRMAAEHSLRAVVHSEKRLGGLASSGTRRLKQPAGESQDRSRRWQLAVDDLETLEGIAPQQPAPLGVEVRSVGGEQSTDDSALQLRPGEGDPRGKLSHVCRDADRLVIQQREVCGEVALESAPGIGGHQCSQDVHRRVKRKSLPGAQ